MKLNKQKWIEEVRRVEKELQVLKKVMQKPDYQKTFNFSALHDLKAEATRLYTLQRVVKIHNLIEASKLSTCPDDAWKAKEALTRYPMEGAVLQRMTEIAQESDSDCRRLAEQALAGLCKPDRRIVDLKSFWFFSRTHYGNKVYSCWRPAQQCNSDRIIHLILEGVPAWKDSFLSP